MSRFRSVVSHWRLTIILAVLVGALAVGLYLAVDQAVDEAVEQAVPVAVTRANATLQRELERRDAVTRRASYLGCVANVVLKNVLAQHVLHTVRARAGTGDARDEHYAALYAADRARILATRPPRRRGDPDTPGARCAARWLLVPTGP